MEESLNFQTYQCLINSYNQLIEDILLLEKNLEPKKKKI